MADTETVNCHLVVIAPFHNPHFGNGDNKPTGKVMSIGEVITEPEVVTKILASHHASFVTKVADDIDWGKEEKKDNTSKPDGAEKKSTGKPDGKSPEQPGSSPVTA